ncbi:MAG TPA: TVP38/TMEM64 family protein [Candidatus Dietzia intestinipullorum]|nr:TVP38/TMEM64 family protein [Candidatus Dietzia intestinipullorum]
MTGRVAGWCAALLALVVAAAFLPLPEPALVREWAAELGPWFPLAFFGTYSVVTVAPVPRSTFTYTAAVFFPPVLAASGTLVATGIAASVAFGVVRRLGHHRTEGLRADPRIAAVDRRLRRRGWLSIASLRMVPAVPFSVLNYAAALSSVRFRHFLPATVLGSAPGTVAAILLGQALTAGGTSAAVWATVGFAVLGLLGIVVDARLPVRAPVDDDEVSQPS